MMRRPQGVPLAALALLAGLAAGGCAYMCHGYAPLSAVVDGGRWNISLSVQRLQPADTPPAPGSVHHWRPDADDRWRLEIVPVAADTTFWRDGDIALADLFVVADGDTIAPGLEQTIDLVAEAAEYVYADGHRRVHQLRFGKFRFVSGFFHLPEDAPRFLPAHFTLVLRDSASGEIRSRIPVRMKAHLDRHRRTGLQDAAEL